MKIPFLGLFRRKKKEEPLSPVEMPLPQVEVTTEIAGNDNIKAKIELLITEMDSMKYQYSALNERLQSIERMIRELYQMAKS